MQLASSSLSLQSLSPSQSHQGRMQRPVPLQRTYSPVHTDAARQRDE